MTVGPNVPFVPGAVLVETDQAVLHDDDDVRRAEDGELVGRSDRDADIRRTREDDDR